MGFRLRTGLAFVLFLLLVLIFMPVIALWLNEPALAAISYLAFHPFCHQLAERSFHVNGIQLAVCARCAGIYAGIFLGYVFFIARSKPVSKLIFVSIFLVACDGVLNALGLADTPAILRFALGLAFGFFSGWLLGHGISDMEKILKKTLEHKWETGNIT